MRYAKTVDITSSGNARFKITRVYYKTPSIEYKDANSQITTRDPHVETIPTNALRTSKPLDSTIHLITDSNTAPPTTSPSLEPSSTQQVTPTPASQGFSSETSTVQYQTSSHIVTPTSAHNPTGTSSNSDAGHGVKTSVIIGSILGSILGFVAIALLLFCVIRQLRLMKVKKNQRENYKSFISDKESRIVHNGICEGDRVPAAPQYSHQLLDIDESIPSVMKPAELDHSPFESKDLLQINHLMAPRVPSMSARRRSQLIAKKSLQRAVSQNQCQSRSRKYYQFKPRPEILTARKAPNPPISSEYPKDVKADTETRLYQKRLYEITDDNYKKQRLSESSSVYTPYDDKDQYQPEHHPPGPYSVSSSRPFDPGRTMHVSPNIYREQNEDSAPNDFISGRTKDPVLPLKVAIKRPRLRDNNPNPKMSNEAENNQEGKSLDENRLSTLSVYDDGKGEYPNTDISFEEIEQLSSIQSQFQSIQSSPSALRGEHLLSEVIRAASGTSLNGIDPSTTDDPYDNYLSFAKANDSI